MGIGKQIELFCQKEGISLRQLALKANVPYSTLYSAVKRDSNGIDSGILKRIAEALNINLVSLLMSGTDLTEVLPSESEVDEAVSDLIAQRKIEVFKQAAYLAGYKIDISKAPYSMRLVPKPGMAFGKDELIAANLTDQEIADAVNQLIYYAGTLCLKMTDVYKFHKVLASETVNNQVLAQKESEWNSATPHTIQDAGQQQPAGPESDKDPDNE